jgi:predicted PurR-regulated permease PerM
MGIHPVWLIVSLAFFGKIGGITGLILALPITAILGVLAKHILKVYYSSAFFNSKGT